MSSSLTTTEPATTPSAMPARVQSRVTVLVRRLPFTTAVLVAIIVAGLATGTLWDAASDRTWFGHIGYGLPALADGGWWTPLTGSFLALTPVFYLPVLLSNILPTGGFWDSVRGFIDDNLLHTGNVWYIVIFGVMIVFFSYFYTAISFDPVKQADTIRKQGGFIPGIRPGPQTERHLAKILSRITLPGALFLAVVALVPQILLAVWNVNSFFGFGGTSLLISVGVALETMKQIDSQLMMRNYESFLK